MIVPVRAPPVAAETEKAMPPLPVPEVEPVSVIHGTSVEAFHSQPAGASIEAVPLPPAASKLWASGATVKPQPLDCDTVTD